MSKHDEFIYTAITAPDLCKVAASLSHSLYHRPLTILLQGELGAGKTTFAQGFAQGLGLKEPITSPTFALEQRYGETLAHLDLYRLKPPQAAAFLAASEDYPGIRLIEWADRAKPALTGDIQILILPQANGARSITIDFHDIMVPSEPVINGFLRDVRLPSHIIEHTGAVAQVCSTCAGNLVKRGIVVRTQALHAAARLHDFLRFLDFKTWDGDAYFQPVSADRTAWQTVRDRYPGLDHEQAGAQFLIDAGYPAIGEMIRTHRGHSTDPTKIPQTTEQKILAYADKRVRFDRIVSLHERFDDFIVRNGKGFETPFAKTWRAKMVELEKELFPEGPPL